MKCPILVFCYYVIVYHKLSHLKHPCISSQFYRSGVWAWEAWFLWSKYHKTKIKTKSILIWSLGSRSYKLLTDLFLWDDRSEVPVSSLAVGQSHSQFLQTTFSSPPSSKPVMEKVALNPFHVPNLWVSRPRWPTHMLNRPAKRTWIWFFISLKWTYLMLEK